MKTHLRVLVLLLLTCASLTGLVAASKHKASQPKSSSTMPVLPPLPGTGELKHESSATDFTFIVAGDNRPEQEGPTQPAITGQIIQDLKQYKPSFILWTGDTIYGKKPQDPKLIKDEYKAFLNLIKGAGVPVFNAPGNHEMNAQKNGPCPAMQALYQKYMVKELFGVFTYGNSRFIALNTDALKKQANCKPPAKKNRGYVNKKQLASLDAYLNANSMAQNIFIFMHRPMEPSSGTKGGLDKTSTATLRAIFAKYKNIAYVLAGHQHLYYNALTQDVSPPPCLPSAGNKPPFYLVTGGAGAPLVGDEPEEKDEQVANAFYNYLVFQVKADKIKATLVNCGNGAPGSQCKAQPSCATR